MKVLTLVLLGLLTPQGPDAGPPFLQVTTEHYALDLRVDFGAEVLEGTARLTVRNFGDQPATWVPLLLYRLMDVRAARDAGGRTLAFEQEVVRFEDQSKLQVTAVRVRLAETLGPGATTTVEVEYGGHLLGYAETGMRYVRDRIDPAFTLVRDDAHAFPTVGVPSRRVNRSAPMERYDYVARITVPDSLFVANGGRLVSTHRADGTATFEYRSLRPSWRMDFAIGRYGVLERPPLRVLHFVEDSAGAAAVVRAADACVSLFTEWFGPLQDHPGLTLLEIPDGWGSQLDVTTVIQSAAAFRDSTRHNEVYHELAHLWQPETLDRPSPRWNEGLASFLEMLAVERLEGRSVVDRRADQLITWLQGAAAANARWREVPMTDYGKEGLTDLSYSVGAIFFDLLLRTVGEQAFMGALGTYYRTYAASGATTADLEAVFAAASDVDVGPLFHDWVYGTGWYEALGDAAGIQDLTRRYAGEPVPSATVRAGPLGSVMRTPT